MGQCLRAETLSITTGQPQTLILDEKDFLVIKGKRVAIIDDVISTGSTLEGIRSIVQKAGGVITLESAILTEGDPAQWKNIIALGNLPLFTN